MGLERDELDPFLSFEMARSFWLIGNLEQILGWLNRATQFNPNYAQAIYARAFSNTLMWNGESGQSDAEHAMALSPIASMQCATLGTRAFSHTVYGDYERAALWAGRCANTPWARALLLLIAAIPNRLGGDGARARDWCTRVQSRHAGRSRQSFFQTFPFRPDSAKRMMEDV